MLFEDPADLKYKIILMYASIQINNIQTLNHFVILVDKTEKT